MEYALAEQRFISYENLPKYLDESKTLNLKDLRIGNTSNNIFLYHIRTINVYFLNKNSTLYLIEGIKFITITWLTSYSLILCYVAWVLSLGDLHSVFLN